MISIRYYCSSNSIFLLNLKITFIVMYEQYSFHVVQIHFEYQILIAIVSIYLTQWRSIRYYCSSNSTFLFQLENYIYCDVWTIFSPHLQIHFEFQIFIDIVSISFISMKIYQILLRLQLNLFSSIGKLHLLWCMYNIQSTFTNTLWISNFHCNCVYMIHLIEDLSDISPASTQTT